MNTTITIEYEKANGMHKKMNNNQTLSKWGNFVIDLGDTSVNGTNFDTIHNMTSGGSNMTISQRLTQFCETGTVPGFSDHAVINFKSGTKTVVSHGSLTSTSLKVNQTDQFDLEIINMTSAVETTKCDLTENLKEFVNFKIMNNSTNADVNGNQPQKFDKTNPNSMKNIYKTNGNPHGMEYGTEDRRITISETYIVNAGFELQKKPEAFNGPLLAPTDVVVKSNGKPGQLIVSCRIPQRKPNSAQKECKYQTICY